jgi:Repeat of Unknown Function (DUF347)
MLSHAVCSPAHRLLPLVRETDGAARTEQAESRRRHPAASLSRRRVSADTVARKVSATVASKVGTTLAHFADRSLGIGYLGGSLLLLGCVLASLALWYRSEGTVSVDTVSTPRAEGFYWLTITFSQTLHRTRGLGGRCGARLSRRRPGVRRAARAARHRLLLHAHLARVAVLGSVHPDASARCDGG